MHVILMNLIENHIKHWNEYYIISFIAIQNDISMLCDISWEGENKSLLLLDKVPMTDQLNRSIKVKLDTKWILGWLGGEWKKEYLKDLGLL